MPKCSTRTQVRKQRVMSPFHVPMMAKPQSCLIQPLQAKGLRAGRRGQFLQQALDALLAVGLPVRSLGSEQALANPQHAPSVVEVTGVLALQRFRQRYRTWLHDG